MNFGTSQQISELKYQLLDNPYYPHLQDIYYCYCYYYYYYYCIVGKKNFYKL